MSPKALITGITGQDGSYLAEFLLDKGYDVVGMVRRSSTTRFPRIQHLLDRITLVPGDLLDQVSLLNIIQEHRPQEVYNLGRSRSCHPRGRSRVLTAEFTALGVPACSTPSAW